MVVPAFRSFWLSGRFSFFPIAAVTENNINLKKGKRTKYIIRRSLPIVKENA
jgi:hypothetical protein